MQIKLVPRNLLDWILEINIHAIVGVIFFFFIIISLVKQPFILLYTFTYAISPPVKYIKFTKNYAYMQTSMYPPMPCIAEFISSKHIKYNKRKKK